MQSKIKLVFLLTIILFSSSCMKRMSHPTDPALPERSMYTCDGQESGCGESKCPHAKEQTGCCQNHSGCGSCGHSGCGSCGNCKSVCKCETVCEGTKNTKGGCYGNNNVGVKKGVVSPKPAVKGSTTSPRAMMKPASSTAVKKQAVTKTNVKKSVRTSTVISSPTSVKTTVKTETSNVMAMPKTDMAVSANAKNSEVIEIQEALNRKGAELPVDGELGERTVNVLKSFQSVNGLPVTGAPDKKTLELLGIQ